MRDMEFGQLPEWIDMGESEDFTTPTVSLAEQLKKRIKKAPGAGDLGSSMGDALGSSATGAMSTAKGGMRSL